MVVSVSVQSQVVTKLRKAIFSGMFSPGEELSRISIGEALRSLVAEKPGHHCFER
jgi:DNA-binding GntR family transcriptional regulator